MPMVTEGLPSDQLQVAQEIVQIVRCRRAADELLDAMLIAITLEDLDFVAWVFDRHRVDGRIPSQVHRLERLAELGMRDRLAVERLAYTRELAAEYHRAVARVRQLTRGGER